MVREKVREKHIFSRSGKSQGILFLVRESEILEKVREKSGNFLVCCSSLHVDVQFFFSV